MTAPRRAVSPDAHRRLLVAGMGRTLVEGNVDLGDERAAMILLRRTHREGDVVALLDDAICWAREMMKALAQPEDKSPHRPLPSRHSDGAPG